MSGFGRLDFAFILLAGLIVAAGGTSEALADDWLRLPSLTYASDAQLGAINRTGFILSPDLSINDQVKLGGTGGALLENPGGFAIGGRVGYDHQVGGLLLGVITDGYYSFADGAAGPAVARSNPSCATTERCAAVRHRPLPALCDGRLCLRRPQGLEDATGVSSSATLSGWTYGGGVEFVWNRDITLYGGYRRIDFDDRTFAALPAGQNTLSPEIDVIDIGWIHRI